MMNRKRKKQEIEKPQERGGGLERKTRALRARSFKDKVDSEKLPTEHKSLVPNNHVEDSKGRAANLWFHWKELWWVTFTLQYTKDYEDYDNYDRSDSSFELQSLRTYNFTKSEI